MHKQNFMVYFDQTNINQRLPFILRSSRKKVGVSVEKMASLLGLSTQYYKNWESGQDIPNIIEWKNFCDISKIDLESYNLGYIDNSLPIQVNDDEWVGLFKIPSRYSYQKAISIRWMRPYLSLFKYKIGESKFDKFLEHAKVDPDYFYQYDNTLNYNFLSDLFDQIQQIGFKSEDMESICQLSSLKNAHGKIFSKYESCRDLQILIKNFVSESNKYDLNYQFELIEQLDTTHYLYLKASDFFLEHFNHNKDLQKFENIYRKRWLENLFSFVTKKKIVIEDIEYDSKKESECIFQIQMI